MGARLAAWLARVGLDRVPAVDAAGLAALQQAQRRSIPFENLDILLGRGIAIGQDAVFDKLVSQRRGGYCFEQNRLFSDMLSAIGFPNRPLLGRVWLNQPEGYVPPRTHTLLLVDWGEGEWIADAGFGGSDVPPLPLRDGAKAQMGDGVRHRLRQAGKSGAIGGEWLLERCSADGWQAQYSFDLSEVAAEDLELCNHWTATRPGTRFTSLAIASIVLPDGFVTLTDRNLAISRSGETERHTIEDAETYAGVLRDFFGLEFDRAEVERLPPFAGRTEG